MKKNCSWCGGLDNDLAHNTGLLLFRLILGLFMLTHGWQKIIHFDLLSAGFPDPFHLGSSISLILIIFAEFGCSILVLLGLFTRFAAIPLIIGMFIAGFIISANKSFQAIELPTLYFSLYFVLIFLGGGRFSLDYVFGIFCDKYCKNCRPTKSNHN